MGKYIASRRYNLVDVATICLCGNIVGNGEYLAALAVFIGGLFLSAALEVISKEPSQ